MSYSYTLEQLKEAVKSSFSMAETIRKLGLDVSGNAYSQLRKNLKLNNIDTTHFKGQGWLKGKTHTYSKPIPLKNIIENNLHPYYGTNTLKKRLIKEGLKQHKCEKCNLTEWLGRPIPIELHHINGDNTNHYFDNLQILCPNCHSLTDNYCSKNKWYSKSDSN